MSFVVVLKCRIKVIDSCISCFKELIVRTQRVLVLVHRGFMHLNDLQKCVEILEYGFEFFLFEFITKW